MTTLDDLFVPIAPTISDEQRCFCGELLTIEYGDYGTVYGAECPRCDVLEPCPGCGGERDHPALRWCPPCRRRGAAVLTDGRMAVRV
jgi:hypothetical protein